MSVPALNQGQQGLVAEEARAPLLPIEGPIVAAVRALEAAKSQAESALLQLQFSPRQEVDVLATLATLHATTATAWNAYAAYAAVRSCEGQA